MRPARSRQRSGRGNRGGRGTTRQSTLNNFRLVREEEEHVDNPDEGWEDVPEEEPGTTGRVINQYFTAGTDGKGNPIAKCNTCGTELAAPDSTTTTLSRHLKSQHPTVFSEYEKKVKERDESRKAKKRKMSEGTRQPTIKDSIETLNPLPNDSHRAKAIKKFILEMIILDYQPLSIVEDIGFNRLIKFFEKRFVMPSRHHFTRRLLPRTHMTYKERLLKILDRELPKAQSITFTTDGWTSRGGTSYFSMTLNYLTEKGFNRSWDIGAFNFPESHTADNIYKKFKNQMEVNWHINIENESKQMYIVADNAPNMKAAFGNKVIHLISCSIHTLQLGINDSLKTVNMESTLKKVRAGVGHYKHSHPSSERLTELQRKLDLPDLELIQMVDTRWNSIYLMLSRYVSLEKALRIDLPETGNADAVLSENDWAMVKGITKVLEPLYEATLQLGSRNCPTFSMILPIIVTIQEKLEEFIITNSTNKGCGVTYARALHKALKSRFGFIFSYGTQSKDYLIATIIDPRFKAVMVDPQVEDRAKLWLTQEANFLSAAAHLENTETAPPSTPVQSGISLWSVLESRSKQAREKQNQESPYVPLLEAIDKQIEEYLKTPNIGAHDDAWEWWRLNSARFSYLAPVALKFLSIPASSIDSERLFSKMGQILTARRARLSASTVEQIVFLHCNYLKLQSDEFAWTGENKNTNEMANESMDQT